MKKKIFAVILAVCCLLSGTASAKVTVQHRPETGKCIVTGTFEQPNMTVNLQILQQGVTEEALRTVDYTAQNALDSLILAAFQLKTDAKGEIHEEFEMNAKTGTYQFRYRTTAASEIGSDSFYYINTTQLADITAQVNAAETAQRVCGILEENGAVCGMDMTYYSALSPAAREKVGIALLGGNFQDFADLQTKFYLSTAEMNLAAQTDSGVLRRMFSEYGELMQLSQMSGYELYTAMNEKQAQNFMEKLIADDSVVSLKTLSAHFCEYAALATLGGIEVWAETESILTKYSDALRIDLDAYHALRSKSAVLKELAGKNFDTAAEFSSYFQRTVQAQAEKESNSVSAKPSGGSGGGGSSSRGGYINPALEEDNVTENNNVNVSNARFEDLQSVGWAAESIEALAQAGILNGKEDGKFYPQDSITREEYLKILVESLGLKDSGAACDFEDVQADTWYYTYVASGVKYGIINGITESEFGTGQPVSRQDMAVMTVRALQFNRITLPNVRQERQFEDNIAAYAAEPVAILQRAGIVSGVSETEFAPERMSSRAEAAKIIYGVLTAADLL